MDTDSPQVEANPLIEADLRDNGGHVAFATIEEAKAWVEKERSIWQKFWTGLQVGNRAGVVLEQQLRLPTKIMEALNDATQAEPDNQPKALREIEELFEQYADYRSLCSKSGLAERLLNNSRRRLAFEKIGGLASILGIPAEEILDPSQADDQQVPMILSGYAIGRMRNVVKRSDIADLQARLEKHLEKLATIVDQAEEEREEALKRGNALCDELDRQQAARRETWTEFHGSAELTWEGIRKAFEEQLHLRAPATYWKERAEKTSAEARRFLNIFAMSALLFIFLVVGLGPELLQRVASIEKIGDFAFLAVLSIPALTGLWILRHIARLFVTNLESSTDATMRQTMVTTFLALTKEGEGSVSKEERLIVLQALFRAPAPNNADDGHLGGALRILTKGDSKE